MALTQSAWTTSTLNRRFVATCTVLHAGTTDKHNYTLKTPDALNTTKPFSVIVKGDTSQLDASTVTFNLYGGTGSDFALGSPTATVPTVTSGVKIKQLLDDIHLVGTTNNVTYHFRIDPNLPVADVVTVAAVGSGLKASCPPMPYFAFSCEGSNALDSNTTLTYTIIQ